jgi:hypothetical protein
MIRRISIPKFQYRWMNRNPAVGKLLQRDVCHRSRYVQSTKTRGKYRLFIASSVCHVSPLHISHRSPEEIIQNRMSSIV